MNAFFLVVAAGFLGSFHCAAMCGPFVGFYSIAGGGPKADLWRHVSYQLGRLTSYLALGALAGWLGQNLMDFAQWAGVQRALLLILGASMILSGLVFFLPKKFRPKASFLHRKLSGLLAYFSQFRQHPAAAGMMGLCSALLPCGYLYAFVLSAGASGHLTSSLSIMAGFWLGTLPALLSLGLVSRYCSRTWLSRLQQMVPVLLIIFGILVMTGRWQGLNQTGTCGHCHTESPAAPIERVLK